MKVIVTNLAGINTQMKRTLFSECYKVHPNFVLVCNEQLNQRLQNGGKSTSLFNIITQFQQQSTVTLIYLWEYTIFREEYYNIMLHARVLSLTFLVISAKSWFCKTESSPRRSLRQTCYGVRNSNRKQTATRV